MIPQVRKLENYSKSTIWVGENLFQNLSKYLDKDFSNCHFITDANVYAYYQDLFPQKNVIVIPAGEASKSFTIIEKIIGELVANNADRHSFLVGVGGGVVCDIAGFVASIYMRGISYIQIPTTLVAQVDSSIGGKTAVDLPEGKNLVGTFNQPQVIYVDLKFLETLPEKEIKNGLAEII
ncbi:MAG TPA: 3-dehydroquinate synthase family protein, partial [Saprospiraceae bacterium]|nr:3-dehydroquinate synthase family protein [Saprospiraceae bacterium]